MSARTAMRFAQYGSVAIGIGALGYCADVWPRARFYQQSETRYFNQELAARNRAATPHRIPRVATRPVKAVSSDGPRSRALESPSSWWKALDTMNSSVAPATFPAPPSRVNAAMWGLPLTGTPGFALWRRFTPAIRSRCKRWKDYTVTR